MTSCSRIPVIRKNSYQSRSSASHALNSFSNSAASYIAGSSSVNRGQSFFFGKAADIVSFEERHDRGKLVPAGARGQVFLVAQNRGVSQQVAPFDVFEVKLGAGLGEVVQCCGISRVRLGLLRELYFVVG